MHEQSRPTSAPAVPTLTAPSRRTLLLAGAAAVPALAVAGPALTLSAPAHADPDVTDGQTRIVDVELAPLEQRESEHGAPARVITGSPATMLGATWSGPVVDAALARGLDAEGQWSPWLPLEIAVDPEAGTPIDALELAWLGAVQEIELVVLKDGADASDGVIAHVVTTSPAGGDLAAAQGTAETAGPATPEALADAGAQSRAGSGTAPETAEGSDPAAAEQLVVIGGAPGSTGGRRMLIPAEVTAAAAVQGLLLAPDAPTFVSRAAWMADESLARDSDPASELKSVVVHHTAGSNSYSRADAPQQLRGILSYHTRTLGWADVGYNVLVDKFGVLYEGRRGGLHRSIIGAHALGFNTGTFGISVMGDYMSAAPPQVAMDALADAIAWKLLGAMRTSASETASFTVGIGGTKFAVGSTVDVQRVATHRDVNYTSCPGNAFYARMGAVRSAVQTRLDSRWRVHLRAFQSAGGEAALGTVTEIAHVEGAHLVTRLTGGVILSSAGGADDADVSWFPEWAETWGRPRGGARQDGARRIQPFENGVAVLESGAVRFVTRRFSDVLPEQQFFVEIHDLAARGITTGWPDGTFRPFQTQARDAMVAFMHRAMGSPEVALPARSPFSDVTPGVQFYPEMVWAAQTGVATGWGDRTFRPYASVQRAAVAAFLHRAAGSPEVTGTAPEFRDVPASHPFRQQIQWCAQVGITTGWPDGTFRPDAPIARDAMAVFMLRWAALTGR